MAALHTEAELIHKAQLKDERAFAELFKRYRFSVIEYCSQLLQNRETAKDAAQNTFIKVYNSLETLRNHDSFKAWLFTIARNEVYALIRRNRCNVSIDDLDVWETPTVHDDYIKQEAEEIIQHLLRRLKPEYREVLLLDEYEGFSYAEIASITNNTVSSIESRIYKARKALSKKIKTFYQ
ncbi:MAG: RNA polymerase sigma factor [bacterium]